jgi:hypothetical protein
MATEMKLTRASKRQLKIDKLCHDLRQSRLALKPYRDNMKRMIKLDAGADWSENAARLRRPYNGISLYKQAMRRALLNQTPRAMLSTWRREYRRTVTAAQNWSNRQFKLLKLGETLDRAATDALFWMGCVKVGITTPIDAERKGYTNRFAGDVYADAIHPDDIVLDMFATQKEDLGFRGHRYRGTVDTINRTFRLRGENKIEADPNHQVDLDGDERAALISRGYEIGDDNTFRAQADVWEVECLPHKAVLTFRSSGAGCPAGEDDLLFAQEYVGPYCGQYTDIGFIPVSGQLLPKGPIVDQIGLDVTMNSAIRKLIRQMERFKQLDLYGPQAKEDMERILNADDGDAVQCANPGGVRPWVSTPPNPQLFALMLQFKQLHSAVSGNLETLLGLSKQAGTARQEELLNRNASATVAAMSAIMVKATSKIMEDMLWYWWHDQTGVMEDVYRLENDPEIQVTREVGPQQRSQVKWEDLEVQVDPYSLTSDTPQARIQQIRDLINLYIPIAPFAQQQGVVLDLKKAFKKEGEYSNNPDVEEILNLVEPAEGASENEGPGKSPVSNRTYTRKSESEATQGGEEADMIQQMMGAGAVGAGEMNGEMT